MVLRNAELLRDLDRDLRAIFGDRMRSLVTYQPIAAADGADSPVATLAVVDSLTATDLRACAERIELWHRHDLATPLILGADEFGRSLDAFPFEFGGILSHYEVVSGPDPFAGLSVDPADLRRACEIQARSHLLHLREGYMETESRSDRVAELIVRSAPALAALLTHVRRLSSGMDVAPVLQRVAELGTAGTISSDEGRRIFPEYLAAMDLLATAHDRWSAA
jgi:hypothetical protein